MTIVYFSGTGNSKFVVNQLCLCLPKVELVSLVAILQNRPRIEAIKELVLVFPVHALTMPIVVRKFLRKLRFKQLSYFAVIATRHGMVSTLHTEMHSLARRRGGQLSLFRYVNMPNNDCRGLNYAPPTKLELDATSASVTRELQAIADSISELQSDHPADLNYTIPLPFNKAGNYLLNKLVVGLHKFSEFIGGVNYFYADPSCTGCGLCSRVCLSNKIQMLGSNPVWQKKVLCYMCFACINFCPICAIQIKTIPYVTSYTTKNSRYGHPFVSVTDMENQKLPLAIEE